MGVLCLSLFCLALLCVRDSLEEKEKSECFAIIVLQMYCKCAVALSHGAVGWSAVCDCGIS